MVMLSIISIVDVVSDERGAAASRLQETAAR